MVPLIAIGALGALAYTGYRAYRKEADRLAAEDERAAGARKSVPRLERDPETGRYRLPGERSSRRD